jgi:hypothetical protein
VKDEGISGISQQSNPTGRTMGSPFYKLTNDPVKTQSNNNAPNSRSPIAIPSHATSQDEEISSAKIPADNTTQIPIKETASSSDELSSNKLAASVPAQFIANGSTKIKNENGELLYTLKMRLVKGEISKEEYLELRKTIEC